MMNKKQLLLAGLVLTSGLTTLGAFTDGKNLQNPEKANGFVEAEIKIVLPDPTSKGWMVILAENDEKKNGNKKVLIIGVGESEGTSIYFGASGQMPPRPLTHDLFAKILKQSGVTQASCFIHTVNGNTFFARLELTQNGKTISIDARPSDAMALSLRMNGKIFVKRRVLEEAGIPLSADDLDADAPREEPL